MLPLRLEWTKPAAKQFRKLDRPIQLEISKRLMSFLNGTAISKPLTTPFKGLHRLTADNYRIILKPTSKELARIVAVDLRSQVYKKLRRKLSN